MSQLILEGEERPLGVQHVAEVHQPHLVLVLCQLYGFLSCGSSSGQRLPSTLLLCIGHQHVFYFFLSIQNRGFVLNQRLFLAGILAIALVGLTARYIHLRNERPEPYRPDAPVVTEEGETR